MRANTKEPTAIDAEVGRRIKPERRKIEFSQSKLGEQVGLTFQQIQKYELGRSRITIGRMVQIAAALGIPLATFTDGLEEFGRAKPQVKLPPKGKRK
jgi:transcriptional regulator with XRE-family HTH domain